MDDFKEYIQENKDRLDWDLPGDEVLIEILDQVKKQRKRNYYRVLFPYLRVACLITVTIGAIWFMFVQNKKNVLIVNNASPQASKTVTTLRSKASHVEVNTKIEKAYFGTNHSKKKFPIKKENDFNTHMVNESTLKTRIFENEISEIINTEKKAINSTPIFVESPAYFDYFKTELLKINREEHEIQSKVRKYGMNNLFLTQLINIYQEKLNVLKRLQVEIAKVNTYKDQEQSVADQPSYLQL